MQVTLDREGCIGCGICAGICPNVFAMAEDGKSEVLGAPGSADDAHHAREAAAACPVNVIGIVDDSGV